MSGLDDLVLAMLVAAGLALSWGAAFGICSRAKRPWHRMVAEWMIAGSAWLLAIWWVFK